MKKIFLLMMVLILTLSVVGCSSDSPAEETATEDSTTPSEAPETTKTVDLADYTTEGPYMLTSLGQSADAAMVKAVLSKTGVEVDEDILVEAEGLEGYKTLIIAVGGSSKGLGAAGIKPEEELARGEKIRDFANANDMNVLVIHVGGTNRRGDLSDMYIKVSLEMADAFLVVKGGDDDGIFSNYASSNKIPMKTLDSIANLQEPFQSIFQ